MCGVKRLIAASAISIKQILQHFCVHACRVGPPIKIEGHTIFAFWLEIDEITMCALGLRH
jgi:acyl homoserine lactone synthase